MVDLAVTFNSLFYSALVRSNLRNTYLKFARAHRPLITAVPVLQSSPSFELRLTLVFYLPPVSCFDKLATPTKGRDLPVLLTPTRWLP